MENLNISIFDYAFATPMYVQSINLRAELLKVPLGLSFDVTNLENEWLDFHIGGFNEQFQIVACLVLSPVSSEEIKIRQVAVSEILQGKGIGKKIMNYAERFASKKGFKIAQLNARKNVVNFYEKLGYIATGPEFEEVNIPHQKMIKNL